MAKSIIRNLEDLKRAKLVAKQKVKLSSYDVEYAFYSLPKRVLGSTASWIIGSVASGIAAAYSQGEPGTSEQPYNRKPTDSEKVNETSYKEKLKGVGEETLYFALGKLVETVLKK